jgi:hypothetical protein
MIYRMREWKEGESFYKKGDRLKPKNHKFHIKSDVQR